MPYRVFVSTNPEGEPPNWKEVTPGGPEGPKIKISAVDEPMPQPSAQVRMKNQEAQLIAELAGALKALLAAPKSNPEPASPFRWTAEDMKKVHEKFHRDLICDIGQYQIYADILNAYMDRSKISPEAWEMGKAVIKEVEEGQEPEPEKKPEPVPEAKACEVCGDPKPRFGFVDELPEKRKVHCPTCGYSTGWRKANFAEILADWNAMNS